jgi:hypothetical protein
MPEANMKTPPAMARGISTVGTRIKSIEYRRGDRLSYAQTPANQIEQPITATDIPIIGLSPLSSPTKALSMTIVCTAPAQTMRVAPDARQMVPPIAVYFDGVARLTGHLKDDSEW